MSIAATNNANAALVAKWEQLLELERIVTQGKAVLPFQVDRLTAEISLQADKKRLDEAFAALSMAELRGFGDYRAANKWW